MSVWQVLLPWPFSLQAQSALACAMHRQGTVAWLLCNLERARRACWLLGVHTTMEAWLAAAEICKHVLCTVQSSSDMQYCLVIELCRVGFIAFVCCIRQLCSCTRTFRLCALSTYWLSRCFGCR